MRQPKVSQRQEDFPPYKIPVLGVRVSTGAIIKYKLYLKLLSTVILEVRTYTQGFSCCPLHNEFLENKYIQTSDTARSHFTCWTISLIFSSEQHMKLCKTKNSLKGQKQANMSLTSQHLLVVHKQQQLANNIDISLPSHSFRQNPQSSDCCGV